MDMLTKSDDRNTDTSRGDIRFSCISQTLTLYRHSIGRVRPKAVSYSAQPVCIIAERCCQVFSGSTKNG